MKAFPLQAAGNPVYLPFDSFSPRLVLFQDESFKDVVPLHILQGMPAGFLFLHHLKDVQLL